MTRRPRLDPEIFHLPVERMREGYYSDKYFVRARELLLADHHRPRVLMQVFGKAHAYLGGVDEAIAHIARYGSNHTDCILTECYGTAAHLGALRRHGPSPQHRLTFDGVLPPRDRKAA